MKTMTRYLMVIAMIFLSSCGSKGRNPTAPLVLKETQLQSDDVAYEAWQVLLSHLDSLGGDDYTPLVKNLPPHWRPVYTTFWLECEVNNGGHHQFFWNSDGALNAETLEDLKYIHADEFAAIFAAALEVYGKHDYGEEKRSSGNTWEGFTEAYKEKRLDECDDRFYKTSEKETVADILSRHILANRGLFTTENAEPEN
jgi:hypothetical protein